MGSSPILTLLILAATACSHALQPRGCNADNCLRALDNDPSAIPFCSSFLATTVTATLVIPTELANCGTETVVARVTSACNCFLAAAVTPTTTLTTCPAAGTVTTISSITVISDVTLPGSTVTMNVTLPASSVTLTSNVTLPASTVTQTQTTTQTTTQTQIQTQSITQTSTQTTTQTATTTVTSVYFCQTGVELIVDGGFEQGPSNSTPWTSINGEVGEAGDHPGPHLGNYYWALLVPGEGEPGFKTATLSQTVNTCGTGRYTLTFWWWSLGDACSTVVTVGGTTVATVGEFGESSDWVEAIFNIPTPRTAFSFESVVLEFVTSDTTNSTFSLCPGMALDDISLTNG